MDGWEAAGGGELPYLIAFEACRPDRVITWGPLHCQHKPLRSR